MIIIGLGNPGKKYIRTRHNIGFRIVEEFAKENDFPEFRFVKKCNALISEKDNIILVKPQTFMNNSGIAVKKIIQNSKATLRGVRFASSKIQNSIVVHDDIDLPLGKIRTSKNRGSAGHKGVESIIKELSSKDFTRLRIGIQPETGKPENVEKFVLEKFDKQEEKIIKQVIKEVLIRMCLFVEGYSHTKKSLADYLAKL